MEMHAKLVSLHYFCSFSNAGTSCAEARSLSWMRTYKVTPERGGSDLEINLRQKYVFFKPIQCTVILNHKFSTKKKCTLCRVIMVF